MTTQDLIISAPALTTADAAAYLSLSESCLNKWRTTGRGPAFFSLGPTGEGRKPHIRYSLQTLIDFAAQENN